MQVPIKLLPKFTEPARINENSDLQCETKKFEDSFSLAQRQAWQVEHTSNEDSGLILTTPNSETEWVRQEADLNAATHLVEDAFVSELHSDTVSLEAQKTPLHDVKSQNDTNDILLTSELPLGFDDKQHSDTVSLEAQKTPLHDVKSQNDTNDILLASELPLGFDDKQHSKAVNLEAPKSVLKSGEGHKVSHDTQLSTDLSESIDDEHLIQSTNAKFFLTTAQANSEHAAAGSDTHATSPAAIIPTTQILESPQTSLHRIRKEKSAIEHTSSTFAFERLSTGHVHGDGTFSHNLDKSNVQKSRIDFLNLPIGLELTSEALSGPYSFTKLDKLYEFSKISTTLPVKTRLKASASSLHYSAFIFNENGAENYDLGRVLHSVIGAKGNSFVNLQQNSAQFVMPTTLHFSSNYNISSKHKIGNGFNTDKDPLANDILRNAAMVKLSAIGDINARNPNDNEFDKSISVDAPRSYKLDMSLNTWQKVLSSQISKAALENITKLQFTINPKKLGRVSITLQMDEGNVNVSISSSNGLVANILQTSEGKLETLLSDHGMKLASYNVSSEQNGRDKRDRAPKNGRQSEINERDGLKTAGGLQSEAKSRTLTTHNGDYDYLV